MNPILILEEKQRGNDDLERKKMKKMRRMMIQMTTISMMHLEFLPKILL